MRDVVIRFLKMDVQMDHYLINWVLAGIWLILLMAAISSIRNGSGSPGSRLGWMAFVAFVPIVGLFVYAIWCLITADWTFLKPLVQSRSEAVRAVTRNVK